MPSCGLLQSITHARQDGTLRRQAVARDRADLRPRKQLIRGGFDFPRFMRVDPFLTELRQIGRSALASPNRRGYATQVGSLQLSRPGRELSNAGCAQHTR